MALRSVLIDTHTFLWMASDPDRLSPRARQICGSEALTLSVASIWEIGIKFHLGRLPLPAKPEIYIARQIRNGGIAVMPILYRHALAAAALPLSHKDPFDRMLAAQCVAEKMPCVTRDKALADYGIEVIW